MSALLTAVRPCTDEAMAQLGQRIAHLLSQDLRRGLGAITLRRLGSTSATPAAHVALSGEHSVARAVVRILDDGIVVASTPGGAGPTPECFDRRWVQSLPIGTRQYLEHPIGRVTSLDPPLTESHIGIIVAFLTMAGQSASDGPVAPVWRWDRGTGEVRRFGLMRCADEALPIDDPDAARVVLQPVPVPERGDLRALAPEDLDLPLAALLNPVCGVVGAPGVRGYDTPATAPVSGAYEVRSKWHAHTMWWGGHADNYSRSEILGVIEGLERIAGFTNHHRPALWATAREIKDRPHVDMSDCGLYAPAFYEKWGDRAQPWTSLPRVPWVHAWSLRDDRLVLVPEQLVYYGDHRPEVTVSVQECSNGCASGASVTEAVLHGLLELIERDAFLLQWHAGHRPTEIDLDAAKDPVVHRMRAQLDMLGYDLRCFDTRVDLPIPTVGAVAVRRDGGDGTLCFAGGASLGPEDAVRAAVCETASYVPSLARRVAENREFLDRAVVDFDEVTELQHHALLYGRPELAPAAAHWLDGAQPAAMAEVYADWEAVRPRAGELRTPTQFIVDLLAEKEFDTVVVDQTTPEQRVLGLATVAVIVPGLVPIDFGWERQRVLEMPRTLWAHYSAGKRLAPLTRAGLLAAPHPFP